MTWKREMNTPSFVCLRHQDCDPSMCRMTSFMVNVASSHFWVHANNNKKRNWHEDIVALGHHFKYNLLHHFMSKPTF